ncbi:unnamed protein product, partial [Ixodes hexagonus]
SLKCNLSCWQSTPGAASSEIEVEPVLGNAASDICTTLWNNTADHAGGTCDFACTCRERSSSLLALYLYVAFVVMGFVASGTVYIMSDSVLCELLGDIARFFGRSRLWGSLGFTVCSPLVGVFIDEANRIAGGLSGYTPCVVLFAVFLLLDMLLLWCTPRLTMTKVSATFLKDVKAVFSCLEVAVFALWACFLGALFMMTSTYSTWLLEDVAGSQLNVGLYHTMTTLVELPLFFLSGPILDRIGYFPAWSLAFASYAVAYVGCSFVRNPWFTLLSAIPTGVAFSLALSSITVFAKEVAPLGTTASVMCILNAVGFEGVGAALGNLLGGIGFGKYGGRAAFRYAGIGALVCAILCSLPRILLQER